MDTISFIRPTGPGRRAAVLAELLLQTYRVETPTDFGSIFDRTRTVLALSEEEAAVDLYSASSLSIRAGLILCNRHNIARAEITYATDTTFHASAALREFMRGTYYDGDEEAA